jgi:hypothetical protein
VFLTVAIFCTLQPLGGELRWQESKKEFVRLRLVALAWNHPRSSFFASEEIFVAEKELDKNETRLVKLVYGFLPYQPRLSETGLDYEVLHEMRAVRDASCDETLGQIIASHMGDWRQDQSHLKYATDAPALNLARHKSHLPCYVTTADDYSRSIPDVAAEP